MVHRITALKLQKRNHQRINVYLDGEFAFGISRFVAAWLQVGQEITDEKISELQSADEREVAYQQSLKFLSLRQRSSQEVRRNLEQHHYSQEVITSILERLEKSGLINDNQFAQAWVDNQNEFRPRSKRALSIELRQRGIDREAIERAIQEVDDEELAYQAAQKQSQKLKELQWLDFRKKLYNFLARRGFGYDVITGVVERVWKENQPRELG